MKTKAKLQIKQKLTKGKKIVLKSAYVFFKIISEIIFLAIEVWTDVLGFIRRIQLARTISLTNRRIHAICWPRLHGDKVRAYRIDDITIIGRERFDGGRPPSALVLKNGKAMPIPSCPPPPYISGFGQIKIK
jgi:hypothetical protein